MKKIDLSALPNPVKGYVCEGEWHGARISPGQNIKVRHEVCSHVFPSTVSRWKLMAKGGSCLRCPKCSGKLDVADNVPASRSVQPSTRAGGGVVRLTYDGQTLTVAQWAARLGVPAVSIYSRLRARKRRVVTDEWVLFGREARPLSPDHEAEKLVMRLRSILSDEIERFLDNLLADRVEPLLLGWLQSGRVDPSKIQMSGRQCLSDPDATYDPAPHPSDPWYVAMDTEGYLVTYRQYREHFGDEAASLYLEMPEDERRMHLEEPSVTLSPTTESTTTPAKPGPKPRPVLTAPAENPVQSRIPMTAISQSSPATPWAPATLSFGEVIGIDRTSRGDSVETSFKLLLDVPDGFGHPDDDGPLCSDPARRGRLCPLYLVDLPTEFTSRSSLPEPLRNLPGGIGCWNEKELTRYRELFLPELRRLAATPGMEVQFPAYPPLSDDIWEDLSNSPWYRWHLDIRRRDPFEGLAPMPRTMYCRVWSWRELTLQLAIPGSQVHRLYSGDEYWWKELIDAVIDPFRTPTHLETCVYLDALYLEAWIRKCPTMGKEVRDQAVMAKIESRMASSLYGYALPDMRREFLEQAVKAYLT